MRILHLIHQLSGGGAERQLSYLAPELVRLGHEVHVAYHKLGPDGDPDDFEGVNFHKLTPHCNLDPGLVLQIRRIIRTVNPDIIQTWILQMDVLGGVSAWLTKTPWVLREPCSIGAYPPSWRYKLRVWSARKSTAIVSNSKAGDDYWKRYYPNQASYIITNGLPIDKIQATMTASDQEVGIDPEEKLILFVGRLEAQKNLTTLIDALASVMRELPARAIFCGEGPLRGPLDEYAREKGIGQSIRFLGFLPVLKIWSLMKRADVFVYISLFEGFPNSVAEAMACGCPLVISDIPEHREMVDERCAWLVDPMNPRQIADRIVRALSDSLAVSAKVEIARRRTQAWSIEAMARAYEKVYHESFANNSPL